VHHVGGPPERGEGEAAAGDLAEDRQVGEDAEPLLRTPAGKTKARDHLVEDE
jgi:hypothetical protein